MSDAKPRVALLARPGDACERLNEALRDIGTEPVLVADPTALTPEALVEAAATVVVVALDPATETAIERFDAAFDAPGVQVLYEEAELAAARSGWEAARWRRHLAAKLFGHGDVLPPTPEGAPSEAGSDTSADTGTADAANAATLPDVSATSEEAAFAFIAGDLDLSAEPASTPTAAAGSTAEARPAFDPVAAEYGIDGDFDSVSAGSVAFDRAALEGYDPNAEGADPAAAGESISFEGLTLDDDGSGTGDALQFEGLEFDDAALPEVDTAAGDFSFELDTRAMPADHGSVLDAAFDAPADAGGSAAAAGQPEEFALPEITQITAGMPDAGLSLVDDEGATAAGEARHEGFRVDLADLERRVAGLSLVDEHVPSEDNGAVVVLAGIGGPDAVRQLLGALPQEFPRPVLVCQRLDGGRYDKLVAQMQRVSAMPVKLAESGMTAEAGEVYVVPPEIGLRVDASRREFVAEPGDLVSALPATDSALLFLSGAEPEMVDAALARKAGGALVAGQSPEGCFDPTAIDSLMARGGETGTPAELAQRLIARWQQRATFGEAT